MVDGKTVGNTLEISLNLEIINYIKIVHIYIYIYTVHIYIYIYNIYREIDR